MGLSVRPPPATIPICALALEGTVFLLTTGWKTQAGGSLVFVVCHNNGKGSGAPCVRRTAVPAAGIDVAYDGSLGDHVQRKNVSNIQGSLLSAVNELSSVYALGANNSVSLCWYR